MATTVTLPFGALNAIPAVSGIEDVTFTVPDVEDIQEEVDRVIDDVLDPVNDLVDDIIGEIRATQDRVDDQVDNIIDEIRNVTVDVPDIEQALEDVARQVLGDLEEDIGGLVADTEALADSIVDQLDVDELEQPLVSFESVFGALREDVVQGFEEALENIAGLPEDLQEDVTNLSEAVAETLAFVRDLQDVDLTDTLENAGEELEAFIEDLPGGTLLLDPDQFIDDQIERVTDGLVEDEARQELEDALERLD